MSGFIDSVRRGFDPGCVVSGRPSRQGCDVSLDGAPRNRVLIDLDKPASPLSANETRCDYLVFAEEPGEQAWFVPLELKKGGFEPGEVVLQLRAGANAAVRVVRAAAGSSRAAEQAPVNFLPVAAVGGKIHRADHLKLRRNAMKVRFGQQKESVKVMRCGRRLADQMKRGSR